MSTPTYPRPPWLGMISTRAYPRPPWLVMRSTPVCSWPPWLVMMSTPAFSWPSWLEMTSNPDYPRPPWRRIQPILDLHDWKLHITVWPDLHDQYFTSLEREIKVDGEWQNYISTFINSFCSLHGFSDVCYLIFTWKYKFCFSCLRNVKMFFE